MVLLLINEHSIGGAEKNRWQQFMEVHSGLDKQMGVKQI